MDHPRHPYPPPHRLRPAGNKHPDDSLANFGHFDTDTLADAGTLRYPHPQPNGKCSGNAERECDKQRGSLCDECRGDDLDRVSKAYKNAIPAHKNAYSYPYHLVN
ncbi:MAG: hypothetical protein HUU38_27230 [Anaerolineales bacterium]|nr:hypothetical protein [Anaerolineales bacterium]